MYHVYEYIYIYTSLYIYTYLPTYIATYRPGFMHTYVYTYTCTRTQIACICLYGFSENSLFALLCGAAAAAGLLARDGIVISKQPDRLLLQLLGSTRWQVHWQTTIGNGKQTYAYPCSPGVHASLVCKGT